MTRIWITRIAKLIFAAIVGAIPFGLWVAAPDPQLIWADWYFGLTTVGKACGIIGLCSFAGNLILSGRYRWLDYAFAGLDRLYKFHRKNGIFAVSLLSAHVSVMVFRPAVLSWDEFWRSTLDVRDLAINFGRVGFFGLVVIVGFTLLRAGRMKYEYLKRTHQFLGAFLFAGGVHAFFIPSDISQNLALRWYVLGLTGAAFASYLLRTVMRRWLVNKAVCDVVAVQVYAGNVTEVVMQPRRGRVTFVPGQFIFVRFRQVGFPYEEHPFSLTASPYEGKLRISAKGIGDFTRTLPTLKPGAVAEVYGPFGAFSFRRVANPRQVWIAGGIGITPFLSMARALRDGAQNPETAWVKPTLWYSVQARAEFVFRDELEAIAKQRPDFTFVPWVTAEQKYLTVDAIKRAGGLDGREFFICGPKLMMRSLKQQLRAAGVAAGHIHIEEFRLL